MDLQISFLIVGVLGVLGFAWGVRSLEKRKLEARMEALQNKLQLAQNRAGEMHERLIQAQAELLQTSRALTEAQSEKNKLVDFALKPWRHLPRGLILAMFFIGLGSGVYIGISETQKSYLVRMTQMEVARSVAEDRLKTLETDFRQLKDEMESLRGILKVETEARVMAETQLALFKGEEMRPNPLHRLSAAFLPWKKESAASESGVLLPPDSPQPSQAA